VNEGNQPPMQGPLTIPGLAKGNGRCRLQLVMLVDARAMSLDECHSALASECGKGISGKGCDKENSEESRKSNITKTRYLALDRRYMVFLRCFTRPLANLTYCGARKKYRAQA
jgi:hypothetical protein